jgi:hypothetical protein
MHRTKRHKIAVKQLNNIMVRLGSLPIKKVAKTATRKLTTPAPMLAYWLPSCPSPALMKIGTE